MPDLFDYKYNGVKIKQLFKEADTKLVFEWRTLWEYINTPFLKKFQTIEDLLNYVIVF
jgi:hypothetical protein